MTRIDTVTGYAWGAAIHCPPCTKDAWQDGGLRHASLEMDDNGIPVVLSDGEGLVGVVFISSEMDSQQCCDTCFEEIETVVIGGYDE